MGLVDFGLFYRGMEFTRNDVNDAYESIRGLFETDSLDDINLSLAAGLPERWVTWNTDSGHDHRDGSLAQSSLNELNFDLVGLKSCEYVLTNGTGTQMIFGLSAPFFVYVPPEARGAGVEVVIPFGTGSDQGSSFQEGVIPTVVVTLFDADNGRGYLDVFGPGITTTHDLWIYYYVTEVNSQSFTVRYFARFRDTATTDENFTNPSTGKWRFSYMALADTPGFLTQPPGIGL